MDHKDHEVSPHYHTLLDRCRDDCEWSKTEPERFLCRAIMPLLRMKPAGERLQLMRDAFAEYARGFQDDHAALCVPLCVHALQDEIIVLKLATQPLDPAMLVSQEFRTRTAELAIELYAMIPWRKQIMMLESRQKLTWLVAERCVSTQDKEEAFKLFAFLADLRLPTYCSKFTEAMSAAIKHAISKSGSKARARCLHHTLEAKDTGLSHAEALLPIVRTALLDSMSSKQFDQMLIAIGGIGPRPEDLSAFAKTLAAVHVSE